jgi:hypothetical protein
MSGSFATNPNWRFPVTPAFYAASRHEAGDSDFGVRELGACCDGGFISAKRRNYPLRALNGDAEVPLNALQRSFQRFLQRFQRLNTDWKG